jgi:hypothetical protein
VILAGGIGNRETRTLFECVGEHETAGLRASGTSRPC